MIKRMQLINAMLQYASVEHTSFDMDDIYYMYNAGGARLKYKIEDKIKLRNIS